VSLLEDDDEWEMVIKDEAAGFGGPVHHPPVSLQLNRRELGGRRGEKMSAVARRSVTSRTKR
jgi:hypothetical protein